MKAKKILKTAFIVFLCLAVVGTATLFIINGHVPVELKKGETPIKCGGKLLVIDGGFSKAYQKKTGIAGYTLVANSHGMNLAAHEPFESAEAAIRKETDIFSDSIIVETAPVRLMVADTDIGADLKERIRYLELLLEAYRNGKLIEKQLFCNTISYKHKHIFCLFRKKS